MGKKLRITQSNLAGLLKEKGKTFKELGEYLGVTTQQAQKYGHGYNEMSLMLLMKICKLLDVNPQDIYPEIEMYDKGFSVPKTKVKESAENLEDLDSEKNVVINNYYNKSNIFADFFSNVRLLDVNAKGALLFKIAVFIIVLDCFLYAGFRLLGQQYAPFIGVNGHLGQLLWSWIIFTWPMSFVLPLLIKHWAVYIITLFTFHGMLGFAFDIWGMGILHQQGQIDAQSLWVIKFLIALVLTLGYAWIVKTYLRSPPKTITKTA
ncbi:MAG: helix-turn-helix transcriptional regulator [Alphaproteobacteria bacterium]|nr:helix-turn-helix transcriptional regulator [Alphaproteobacteria bacterium]